MLLSPDAMMSFCLDRASPCQVALEKRAVLREYLGKQASPSMLIKSKRARLFGKQRVPKIK